MSDASRDAALAEAALGLLCESVVTEREYGPRFASAWRGLFAKALERGRAYLPENDAAILAVSHSFDGVDAVFHFDQLKLADWFARESEQRIKRVFEPKKLRRTASGVLTFHESVCDYDSKAAESAIAEEDRNIMACALPGLPPAMRVVYGNKWVESRFTAFNRRSLQLFLIKTDYVPAFLGSDLEICLYLFLMDCCIIRENYTKVKDSELAQFLHVFRPSPMLLIKGLAEPAKA